MRYWLPCDHLHATLSATDEPGFERPTPRVYTTPKCHRISIINQPASTSDIRKLEGQYPVPLPTRRLKPEPSRLQPKPRFAFRTKKETLDGQKILLQLPRTRLSSGKIEINLCTSSDRIYFTWANNKQTIDSKHQQHQFQILGRLANLPSILNPTNRTHPNWMGW